MTGDNFIERLATLTLGNGTSCETCGIRQNCKFDCVMCDMVACGQCMRLRFPPEAQESQKTGWMCPECYEVNMWCK